jgi:hypothetical protein
MTKAQTQTRTATKKEGKEGFLVSSRINEKFTGTTVPVHPNGIGSKKMKNRVSRDQEAITKIHMVAYN